MSLFCRRWSLEDVGIHRAMSDLAWSVYSVIGEENGEICDLQRDLSVLSPQDKEAAKKDLRKLMLFLDTGQRIEQLFDEKQCHSSHEFVHEGSPIKIWRLRLSRVLRFYFVYGLGRKIVLLQSSAKREDRLSRGEKEQLEELARRVLSAIANGTIEF
jgi:hypothetical protein